ncbi:MAG TPA: hypothetical protein VH914_22040 [Acidimicrobiia bacterium]|jgi:catechol 2,3-dioxygenase-like lactoylglutathione lyase family enzyme|nr:hypothetical protein [Acidimicrobiia bacterium]
MSEQVVGIDHVSLPMQRVDGGRRASGTSVYTRDPDGNLVELLTYESGGSK